MCFFYGTKEEKNNKDIIMVGVKELGGSVWWTLLRNKMCVLWASLVLIYLQCKLVFGGCDDKIVLCFLELGMVFEWWRLLLVVEDEFSANYFFV